MPSHYPLLFAVTLVAVFANGAAIRRFRALYVTLKARPDSGTGQAPCPSASERGGPT